MWLKFVVCGVKTKSAHIFLQHNVNECPPSISNISVQSLAAFCLPLGPESQTPKERMSHEEYTFTLTQGDGSRVQGFCRRCLPPAPRVGSKLRFPQVLCVVCEAAWPSLFFKVLEVAEQLLRQTDLLLDFEQLQLPASSYAGAFLNSLGQALEQQPALGSIIRVALPPMPAPLSISPPKRISPEDSTPLAITDEFLELQVPPDCGNGASNAGVSLARLLWHVPVPAMLTLIASLLRERRVLVVGQSRDMVSAAVTAAAALIYPFRWHHIYLPLLPRSLKDYLTAPMPFLIGMPAQLLPALKGIPMDEVTLIDLDLGRCEPSPGSAADDALLLPWRDQLEAALHAAFGLLRSPTEHESNPLIANIMQGYFLKLLGTYRSHIYPDGSGPGLSQGASPRAGYPRSPSPAFGMHGSSSSSSLTGLGDSLAAAGGGGGGSRPASAGSRHTPNNSLASVRDDCLRGGNGSWWFDHAGLVASHRHNERARAFLQLLRQSQLYEVFIRERLDMAAATPGGPELSGEPFEQLVNAYLDNRANRLAVRLGAGVRSGLSRFTAFVKKHRRTESSQHAAAGGGGGGAGGFSLSGFSEGPEAARLKLLASTFAAAAVGAGKMRRNLTEGSSLAAMQSSGAAAAAAAAAAEQRSPSPPAPGHGHGHRHTVSAVEGLADRVNSSLDPSAFFQDEEDDLDEEAEAAEAAAAAAAREAERQQQRQAGSGGGRFSRNSSSSSLKDLASSGNSWTAAGGGGSSGSPFGSFSFAKGLSGAAQGQQQQQQQMVPPLQRRSVPLFGSGASGAERPVSPPPLINLAAAGDSHSNCAAAAAAAAGGGGGVHAAAAPWPPQHPQAAAGLQSRSNSMYLQHQAQLLQQHQHPQQQHQQQRSPSLSSAAALTATAGPGSAAAAAAAAASHRSSQHQHIKAALASIPPGPLPQPPLPRGKSVVAPNPARTPQAPPAPAPPAQQQQQQQQQAFAVVSAAAVAAGGSSGGGQKQDVTAGSAAAVWDPFLELLSDRTAAAPGASGALGGAPAHSNSGSGITALSEQQGPLTCSSRGASSSDGGAGHLAAAQGFGSTSSSSRTSAASGGGDAAGSFGAGSQQQWQRGAGAIDDLLSLSGSFPVVAGGSKADGSSLIELVADCSHGGVGAVPLAAGASSAGAAGACGASDPGIDELGLLMARPAGGVSRSDSLLDM